MQFSQSHGREKNSGRAQNRRRALAALVIPASGLLLTLSGCSGTPPTPPATVFVTVAPTVTPTPTPVETTPPPAAEAPAVPDEPPVTVEIVPNAPAAPIVPGPAIELGAASGARGSTTSDGNGALLTYTVVSDDVFFDIAQRFDLPQQQLLQMNPSIPSLGTKIYIGQVINLDWTTTK